MEYIISDCIVLLHFTCQFTIGNESHVVTFKLCPPLLYALYTFHQLYNKRSIIIADPVVLIQLWIHNLYVQYVLHNSF